MADWVLHNTGFTVFGGLIDAGCVVGVTIYLLNRLRHFVVCDYGDQVGFLLLAFGARGHVMDRFLERFAAEIQLLWSGICLRHQLVQTGKKAVEDLAEVRACIVNPETQINHVGLSYVCNNLSQILNLLKFPIGGYAQIGK